MRLGDLDSYIELDVREAVAVNMPRAGDLRLRITLRGAGFSGVQDDVWVPHLDAERFILDLNAMAAGQREEAVLKGSSSSELILRFSRPMPTHILVEGKLKRMGPGSPATISAAIAFAIYLLRADLRTIAETLTETWMMPMPAGGRH
jgi:hypothetical protein